MLPVIDCIARGIDHSLPNLWWIWWWLRHLPLPTLRYLQSHGWTRSASDLPTFFWNGAKKWSSNTPDRTDFHIQYLYIYIIYLSIYIHMNIIYIYIIFLFSYRTQIFCSLHSQHCFTASHNNSNWLFHPPQSCGTMGPLSPVGPGFMDFKPPKRRGAMGRVAGRAGSDTVDVSATGPSGVSGRSGVDPSGPPGMSSLLAASVTSASSENDEQNGSSSVIKKILYSKVAKR